jgi:hypothetical protein
LDIFVLGTDMKYMPPARGHIESCSSFNMSRDRHHHWTLDCWTDIMNQIRTPYWAYNDENDPYCRFKQEITLPEMHLQSFLVFP